MSQDDLFGAPAGWYPDPLGLPQLRWWNNHAWTEQTSAARQPMVIQDTKFAWADDEVPTRRGERERERSEGDREPADTTPPTAEALRELEPPRAFTKIEEPRRTPAPAAQAATAAQAPQAATAAQAPQAPSAESLYQPDPIVAPRATPSPSFGALFDSAPQAPQATAASSSAESLDDLFGSRTERRATRRPTPLIMAESSRSAPIRTSAVASTGPGWVIAVIPLIQLVLSLLLLTTFGMGANWFVFVGILVVPYFVIVGLAYLDYSALKSSGHSKPAHWAWSFLTAPVYLLLRARSVISETGHGIGPVLVWFGNSSLLLVAAVAVPGLLISLLPAMFSAQIEQSVASDALLISGAEMQVSCPSVPPVLFGEETECTAINSNGTRTEILVSLERANGWINWQVLDWGTWGMES
jgi:hypothetical protein